MLWTGQWRLTINTVLLGDDLLQGVVGLGTHLDGLGEGRGTGGEDHELLESKGVSGVRTTVDDVEGGAWEDVRRGDTGEGGDPLVKWDTLQDQLELVRLVQIGPTLSAAPASETAMETPRMALAPSLPLLGVPSSLMRRSSISFCEVTGILESIRAGAMISLTFLTALETPGLSVPTPLRSKSC